MLNWVFLALVLGAVVTGAFNGTLPQVTRASLDSAKGAVNLILGLVGPMMLWLGLMAVLREAGVLSVLARLLRPVLRRLFPDVPPDHPAMGMIVLNVVANMLGLGNAATPFGLKAMTELESLNPRKGVATDAMALFLALNTSGLAVLALGAVTVRASLGSHDPAGILLPSLLATLTAAVVGVGTAKLLARVPRFSVDRAAEKLANVPEVSGPGPASPDLTHSEAFARAEASAALQPRGPRWASAVALVIVCALAVAVARAVAWPPADTSRWAVARGLASDWTLPFLMAAICLLGLARGVKVYDVVVTAAKEGLQIALAIVPFLVAMLVSVGMFRASGALGFIVDGLAPITARLGFPAEALPMALLRPFSASGALAVMTETMRMHGPDSFIGYLVSVLNGSTETTFYVLAVYFGSVRIRATRYTVLACLAADVAGVVAATVLCHVFFVRSA